LGRMMNHLRHRYKSSKTMKEMKLKSMRIPFGNSISTKVRYGLIKKQNNGKWSTLTTTDFSLDGPPGEKEQLPNVQYFGRI
jgi:hypothetical protein